MGVHHAWGRTYKDIFQRFHAMRARRERVDKFAATITQLSKRLGQWMDWERSYYTFDDSNIEHIWLFLKKCGEEGWLAQDYRVMPWCPRCETSLSQHESADSYKEITHRSVYIKLPILERPGDSFLVWTTTPWTLTANVAVALHPDLTYVRARTEDDVVILSKGTVATALK